MTAKRQGSNHYPACYRGPLSRLTSHHWVPVQRKYAEDAWTVDHYRCRRCGLIHRLPAIPLWRRYWFLGRVFCKVWIWLFCSHGLHRWMPSAVRDDTHCIYCGQCDPRLPEFDWEDGKLVPLTAADVALDSLRRTRA